MNDLAQMAYVAYSASLMQHWKATMNQDGSLFKIVPWEWLRTDQQMAWRCAVEVVRHDLQEAE